MTFIVRIKIIAVNNPHRIIQLQTEFKSQAASWIAFQHPLLIHLHTDPGRNLDGLSWLNGKISRGKEIIACASGSSSSWKTDSLINLLCLISRHALKSIHPVCHKALFTYFMKFCNSFHVSSCLSRADAFSKAPTLQQI